MIFIYLYNIKNQNVHDSIWFFTNKYCGHKIENSMLTIRLHFCVNQRLKKIYYS